MVELCNEILLHGVCTRERSGCLHHHDVYQCQPCHTYFKSQGELQEHLKSDQHKRKVSKLSVPVRCGICGVPLQSPALYPQHADGRRHRVAFASSGLNLDPGPEEVDTIPGQTHCEVCDIFVSTFYLSNHLKTPRHQKALGFVALSGALDEAERNKHGVLVSDGGAGLDFGVLDVKGDKFFVHTGSLSVENTNPSRLVLYDGRITSHGRQGGEAGIHFYLPLFEKKKRIRMAAGATREVSINFQARDVLGRFEDRVELYFQDPTLGQTFAITRPLRAIVGNKADHELLKPTAPYLRPKRKPEIPIGEVLPGIPPPALAAIQWKAKLEEYPIPPALLELANGSGSVAQIAERVRNAHMPKAFANTTYGRHFRVLLWVEEEQTRRDLQQYNLPKATLNPGRPKGSSRYYTLEIDGLAEKRPSVIISDKMCVRNYGSVKNHWFEGCVHSVHDKTVELLFNPKFNSYKGQLYEVRFELNRLTLRRQHQALGTVFTRQQVLFPGPEHAEGLRPPTAAQMKAIRCVDRKVGENPPQLQAVAAVIYRPLGSVPFIVFGPPGTGKTVTVIESIRQLLLTNTDARILACAPSNSASDIIAERLADLGKTQIFRLMAPSRTKDTVPAPVLKLTQTNSDGIFSTPSPADLRKFRVVVSTCFSASVPYGIGVPRGHFTHIFIDECGQGTEPEIMIPIKTMADNSTNIILSGDYKQLGPIVRSPVARELGLAMSYLDRMMSRPVYDEDTGSGTTLVKLTKNWRSHADILKFPNEEFYRSQLEARGNPAVTHSMLRWDMLPTKNFPIIFHGISGRDMREASSPSFFNPDEASLVKTYVQQLFGDTRLRLTAQHIGIISPYNAQVGKIRTILRPLPKSAKDIKVGSVEEFQGLERRVIILSTVRSSVEEVRFDLRHTLGFVANPRRFNVAVTRAQALLVVIGDPVVLSLDPLWKSFINFVHTNGGCTGKRIDWDSSESVDRTVRYDEQRRQRGLTEMDDLIERTRSLVIGQTEDLAGRDEDEDMEGNADRPWREDE